MSSVKEWLASLGLSESADRFAEHQIDFSILRDLTDRDLKENLASCLLATAGDCSGRLPILPKPLPLRPSLRLGSKRAEGTKPSAAKSR